MVSVMGNFLLMSIASFALWLGGFLIGLLILWAVIRSAVLSALRKHAED